MADDTRSTTAVHEAEERVRAEMDRSLTTIESQLEGMQDTHSNMVELRDLVRQISLRLADVQTHTGRGRGDNHDTEYYLPTRYTKLDFSSFSAGDVDTWIAKCERFFSLDGTPDHRKTLLASIALDNDAYRWFQYFERGRNGVVPWPDFVTAMRTRFGPLYDDPMEDLMKLRQTGSLADFQRDFDNLMCKIDMPETKRLSCFLGGLKPEIATGVKLLRPQSVLEATKLARLQESNLESLQLMAANRYGNKGTPMFSRGLLPTPSPPIMREAKRPIPFEAKTTPNSTKGVLGRPNLSLNRSSRLRS